MITGIMMMLRPLCVCWLFIFKDTEPSPLQDSFSVRQQGGLPGPPPRCLVPLTLTVTES